MMPKPPRTDGHTACGSSQESSHLSVDRHRCPDFGDDWSMRRHPLDRARRHRRAGRARVRAGPDGLCQRSTARPVDPRFSMSLGEIARLDGIQRICRAVRSGTALTYAVTMPGMLASAAAIRLFFRSARRLVGARASLGAALGLARHLAGLGPHVMAEPTSMLMLILLLRAAARRRAAQPLWLAAAAAAPRSRSLRNVALVPGSVLAAVEAADPLRRSGRRCCDRRLTLPVPQASASSPQHRPLRNLDRQVRRRAGASRGKWWSGLHGLLFSPGRSMPSRADADRVGGGSDDPVAHPAADRRPLSALLLIPHSFPLAPAVLGRRRCWSPRCLDGAAVPDVQPRRCSTAG